MRQRSQLTTGPIYSHHATQSFLMTKRGIACGGLVALILTSSFTIICGGCQESESRCYDYLRDTMKVTLNLVEYYDKIRVVQDGSNGVDTTWFTVDVDSAGYSGRGYWIWSPILTVNAKSLPDTIVVSGYSAYDTQIGPHGRFLDGSGRRMFVTEVCAPSPDDQ